jgi:hypothetical protein
MVCALEHAQALYLWDVIASSKRTASTWQEV